MNQICNAKKHCLLLGLLAVIMLAGYFLPLNSRPMMRPDEFRYAEIPREMLVSGDWIVPKLCGVRYFEKPVLGYQMTALSFKIFGETPFALRLPSVLAVMLSAFFLYFFLWRKTRDFALSFFAPALYLSFGLVFGVGTFAVLDSQLSAALTLCIGFFFLALSPSERKSTRFLFLALCGVFAGTAFLLKGLLAFAIPAIVACACLLWRRDWKKLFLTPWIPLLFALLLILPWSIEILKREPDFWRYFLVEEHWMRFTGETYDRKPQPFWYFIPVLLGGMLPPGLLWISAWRSCRKNVLSDPLFQEAFCWFVLPFLFFSASSCKLGTYILPCFAPLAILLAFFLLRAFRGDGDSCTALSAPESVPTLPAFRDQKRLFLISGCVLLSLGGLLGMAAVLLPLIQTKFAGKIPRIYDAFPTFLFLCACAMALWGFALIRVRSHANLYLRLVVFLGGMFPVLLFGVPALPAALFGDSMPERGIREGLQRVGLTERDLLLVDKTTLVPATWTTKRLDLIVLGRPGELLYGFTRYPDEYGERHIPEFSDLSEWMARHPGRRIFFLTFRDLKKKPLPLPCEPLSETRSDGVTILQLN